MKENILLDKSLYFAAKVMMLSTWLIKHKREHMISKQIMRSATSIGANINEANYGISKADFISKMHISLKETAETEYWIRLLFLSELIEKERFDDLLADCLEIKRILVATLNTAKSNK